ncbi:hypothetical protein [Methylobacterium tarhaniae]|uniref:hypothetical protein n=1 Tax=Methylobacterium tarhaniae TaxID=1187852 RepID=UPI000A4F7CF5|nr:hypothetical protein [Methylobacterium tarhaniae]
MRYSAGIAAEGISAIRTLAVGTLAVGTLAVGTSAARSRRRVAGLAPLLLAFAGGPALAEEADLPGLETRWHACVRQAFTGQPLGMERRAAQRAALAACKPQEDAYVHAMLAAQEAEARARTTRGVIARARDWAFAAAGSARATVGGVIDRLRW